jgi:molybdopterin synthase sulfur carrier subunit
MELELRFFATYREAVGQKTIFREFEGGSATVGEVLRRIEAEFDGLEGQILDDDGDILDMLTILRNGREVDHLDGTNTLLEDEDALSMFPPVAGG